MRNKVNRSFSRIVGLLIIWVATVASFRLQGALINSYIDDGLDRGCPVTCQLCDGSPVWGVTEPYCTLWAADVPMFYKTSRGERFEFRLTYKQRDTRPQSLYYLPLPPPGWNNNWLSFVAVTNLSPGSAFYSWVATVYLPGGGEARFSSQLDGTNVINQVSDKYSGMQLLPLSGLGNTTNDLQSVLGDVTENFLQIGQEDGQFGLRLLHPDGSQDLYTAPAGEIFWTDANGGSYPETLAILWTRHIDPAGRSTRFNYQRIQLGTNFIYYPRLAQVVDADGRTNLLSYTAFGNNDYLTQVTGPYGHTAQMTYDLSGQLTNIVDALGLSSHFDYNESGLLTNLVTPYGASHFFHSPDNEGARETKIHLITERRIVAVNPMNETNVYWFRLSSAELVATNANDEIPQSTPYDTLDTSAANQRLSFHWNPRQAQVLPEGLTNLTPAQLNAARIQHWLTETNDAIVSGELSWVREPAPDTNTVGPITFMDYPGKTSASRVGTQSVDKVISRRLTDGNTQYAWSRGNSAGLITNLVTTWQQPDGSIGTRTNVVVYDNWTQTNVLRLQGNFVGTHSLTNTWTMENLFVRAGNAEGVTEIAVADHPTANVTNVYVVTYHSNTVITITPRLAPGFLTNALQEVTQAFFNATNRLTGLRTGSGLVVTNLFDSGGSLTNTTVLTTGASNLFTYSNGLVRTWTSALGLRVTNQWDALNRLTAASYPDGSFTSNYFNKLDLSAKRDRLGNWTYFDHDLVQRLTAITNANQALTLFNWCGCGGLESIVDALNHSTTFTRNNQGLVTTEAFPDLSSVTRQFDALGRPTNVVDGAGRAIKYGYNHQGLVDTINNAYGRVESILYDILDRPQIVTDATGLRVTNQFDLLNRVTNRTWMDGFSEKYVYRTNGLVAFTNRNGKFTLYTRDAAGRPLTVTNANQEGTRFVYNSAGQLTELYDGLEHRTQWSYDEYGRQRGKTNALNRVTTWDYNPNGWLTNRTLPQTGNTAYSHDAVGNLTNVTYVGQASSLSLTYDLLNRLTNMVDAVGTTKFTWTASSQISSEDGPWANDTVTNIYTEGLRTAMSVGNTWSQAYAYDLGGRMTALASPAGTFNYAYADVTFHVSRITLPNLDYITNHFDSLGRLDYTAMANLWGQVLDGYGYIHDPLGLRTNVSRDYGLTTSTAAAGYDDIGQLIGWNAKEAGGALRFNEQLGWNYDKAGNLNFRTNNALLQTFSVDSGNQLSTINRSGTFTVTGNTPAPATNVTVNGASASRYGDFTFAGTNNTLVNGDNTFQIIAKNTYGLSATNSLTANLSNSITLLSDLNGNLTNDGLRNFAYDGENQLTTNWVAGAWKSEFVYDGFGRRRITRDYAWQSGNWALTNETHSVCDGPLPIQDRGGSNNVLVTLTRGLDFSASISGAGGIGGLLARTDSSGSAFYHSDGSGNVTALMTGVGEIVARYQYDPFGRQIGKWGALADSNRYRFSSKELHLPSGLYYYGFRYYEPNWQRWLNEDPIGEEGGINLYGFVGNSPANALDPLGLSLFDDFGEWELNTLQKIKEFFTGKPGDLKLNDMDTLRAGSGLIEPLRDENGERITEDVLFDIGLAVMTAPLGGPEREGLTIFGDAVKAKKVCQVAKGSAAAEKAAVATKDARLAAERMPRPHDHHILFEKGIGKTQQALVKEGSEILGRYGINHASDAVNRVIAPNIKGQHIIANLEEVVNGLKEIEAAGGTKEDVVRFLRRMGETAANRR